jgi:hypothetical protein
MPLAFIIVIVHYLVPKFNLETRNRLNFTDY